jgi:hypothetical protein
MDPSVDSRIEFAGDPARKAAAIATIDRSLGKHGKLDAAIGDLSAGVAALLQMQDTRMRIREDGDALLVEVLASAYDLTFRVDRRTEELSHVVLGSIEAEPPPPPGEDAQ